MKNRKSPVGQYIFDGMGDTEDALDYVDDFLPLIGEVVLFFNGLEAEIDNMLCFQFSDRSDQLGLLVLHKMMYSTKVELFEKMFLEKIQWLELDVAKFKALVSELRQCGTLRNRIVHANWEYTDESGYTHVRFTFEKNGLQHELTQFSVESLRLVIQRIIGARESLGVLSEEIDWQIQLENQKSAERIRDLKAKEKPSA